MTHSPYPGLEKVVSGGQTGVDRAALDAAVEAGLEVGGWCPKGRLAEDGVIPARYGLREMSQPGYPPRTRRNVKDADATLILSPAEDGEPTGGTRLTVVYAMQLAKPFRIVSPGNADPAGLARWLREGGVRVLNVAGPKESKVPGIHDQAKALLGALFRLAARPAAVAEPAAAYAPPHEVETAARPRTRRRRGRLRPTGSG